MPSDLPQTVRRLLQHLEDDKTAECGQSMVKTKDIHDILFAWAEAADWPAWFERPLCDAARATEPK